MLAASGSTHARLLLGSSGIGPEDRRFDPLEFSSVLISVPSWADLESLESTGAKALDWEIFRLVEVLDRFLVDNLSLGDDSLATLLPELVSFWSDWRF